MNKIAIFVEGHTEQIFVEKLITEIAGANSVQFARMVVAGSNRAIALGTPHPTPDLYVLIVNSGADNAVASDVKENYASLTRNGYSSIIGIRDVFPLTAADIDGLRKYLGYGIKTNPIKVSFVLAVMEIEAWFLSEHTHFSRVHPELTLDRIVAGLKFDPSADDMTLRANPAEDLHNAYKIVGLAYRKHKNQIHRTVGALDYANLYLQLRQRVPAINELISAIESFLTRATG
jgi:hypothetical protein